MFTGAIVAVKLDIGAAASRSRALRPTGRSRSSGPSARATRTPTSPRSPREPNVHLLGPARLRRSCPSVLRGADAGLIPYARNELTESIFPMKVYEYLAAGLPVVATPLPALAGRRRRCCAPPDADGIAALLDAALAEDTPERRARALASAAAGHSWERRLRGDRGGDRGAVRDLLVTTHTPVLRSGRAVRTYGVARALAARRRARPALRCASRATSPTRPSLRSPAIELHEVVSSRGAAPRCWPTRARALGGVPAAIARGISPELAAAAARLAAAPGRGRVIADGPVAAATLRGARRAGARSIYNAHNLESGFRHELGDAGRGSPRDAARASSAGCSRAPPSPGW